jgi:uncharacterized protein
LVLLAVASLLMGVSKTSVPGIFMLAIPLTALVIPARASTGFVLPLSILGDICAVAFYRRHANWSHLVRLIPSSLAGIILGYFALGHVTDRQLKPIIGAIILALLALDLWRDRAGGRTPTVPHRTWVAATTGLLAGFTTMLANASGPIVTIYLLAMQFSKNEFVGTAAWYFLLLNLAKVPFSANLGLIDPASLRLNLVLAPVLLAGTLVGVTALRRIPQRLFNTVAQVLAGLAALRLLF